MPRWTCWSRFSPADAPASSTRKWCATRRSRWARRATRRIPAANILAVPVFRGPQQRATRSRRMEKSVYEIIDRVKKEKPDAAALQRVKTNLRAALIQKLDSNSGLASELCVLSGQLRRLAQAVHRARRIQPSDRGRCPARRAEVSAGEHSHGGVHLRSGQGRREMKRSALRDIFRSCSLRDRRRAAGLRSVQDSEVSAAAAGQDPRAGGVHALERHARAPAGGSRAAADPRPGADPHRQPVRSAGQARAFAGDGGRAALGRHQIQDRRPDRRGAGEHRGVGRSRHGRDQRQHELFGIEGNRRSGAGRL